MKKNMTIKRIGLISVITALILFVGNNYSYALEDEESYSELYKQYLELSDEEKAKVDVIPEKYNVTLKEYNVNKSNSATLLNASNTLPKRYNLAEHYDIKVESQGQEGNCWAFASLETLETYLQIHGFGTFDFSENHLNYVESNLFSQTNASRKINTAGNYELFQEYANKKFGPALETDYPYYEDENQSIHKNYTQDELDSLLKNTPLAYVGEYVTFPSVNKDEDEYSYVELEEYRQTVKKHIMENGAIYTAITAPTYYKGEFYNINTFAAYFPTTDDSRFMEHAHAVAIIGWDDDFSKDNFIEENRPKHDGAYIALNSWGKDFGESGIYYISYDDAFAEQNLCGIKEAVKDISQLKNTTTFSFKDKNLYNAIKNILGRKIVRCKDSTHEITILSGLLGEIVDLE